MITAFLLIAAGVLALPAAAALVAGLALLVEALWRTGCELAGIVMCLMVLAYMCNDVDQEVKLWN